MFRLIPNGTGAFALAFAALALAFASMASSAAELVDDIFKLLITKFVCSMCIGETKKKSLSYFYVCGSD